MTMQRSASRCEAPSQQNEGAAAFIGMYRILSDPKSDVKNIAPAALKSSAVCMFGRSKGTFKGEEEPFQDVTDVSITQPVALLTCAAGRAPGAQDSVFFVLRCTCVLPIPNHRRPTCRTPMRQASVAPRKMLRARALLPLRRRPPAR
jgi:hypothetical protein